uniref:Uncharacterized protein n=1 Tax=Rhizophora mucronata TaxID=61149 RepID=A0A2P2Q640_RHIMU
MGVTFICTPSSTPILWHKHNVTLRLY